MNKEQTIPGFKFWTQQMNEYWETFYPMLPPFWGGNGAKDASSKAAPDDPAWTWETIAQSQFMRESMESLMKMVQPVFEEMYAEQLKNFEKIAMAGEWSKAFSADGAFSNAFQNWYNYYESDMRRFLNIPQLGLTRFYQERFNQAADRFNLFMASSNELFQILMHPFKDSFLMLQNHLKETNEKGSEPPDSQKAYEMWIKILEKNFLSLLQSEQYTCALSKTLAALEDFIAARKGVLQDVLKWYHIPAEKDMDEMYKEVYQLKKRVQSLEKRKTTRGKNVSIKSAAV